MTGKPAFPTEPNQHPSKWKRRWVVNTSCLECTGNEIVATPRANAFLFTGIGKILTPYRNEPLTRPNKIGTIKTWHCYQGTNIYISGPVYAGKIEMYGDWKTSTEQGVIYSGVAEEVLIDELVLEGFSECLFLRPRGTGSRFIVDSCRIVTSKDGTCIACDYVADKPFYGDVILHLKNTELIADRS